MVAEETFKRLAYQWLLMPLILLLVALTFPLIILVVTGWLLYHLTIRLIVLVLVWMTWSTRGISILTVYSNSPHWQDYFEKGVLPLVNHQSKVLNWSDRSIWPVSFKRMVFSVFKGEREYNPMIIYFAPFRWPKMLRFYQAFRDARHGREAPLRDLENELSLWIDQPLDLEEFHPCQSA